MKRFIFKGIMAAATVVLAASCVKQGAPWFSGDYNFKTSGTITVSSDGGDESDIALTDESGQLKIITIDRKNGSMLVTMNIVGGPVLAFDAIADGKDLELEPSTRKLTVNVGGISSDSLRPTALVDVSGSARRYDKTILLYLNYEGSYTYLGTTYDIVESDIRCVAWLKE